MSNLITDSRDIRLREGQDLLEHEHRLLNSLRAVITERDSLRTENKVLMRVVETLVPNEMNYWLDRARAELAKESECTSPQVILDNCAAKEEGE